MERKSSYTYEDLLDCAHGKLFGEGNARLPLPPMLMLDRILKIASDGGKYGKGEIHAELDIKPNLWFFPCHFESDPVMPGCLGLDAMWQLVGFFLGWSKAPGKGRALSVGEVKFSGEVTPESKKISFQIDIKKLLMRKFGIAVADGCMYIDGKLAYECKDMRVGVFPAGMAASAGA